MRSFAFVDDVEVLLCVERDIVRRLPVEFRRQGRPIIDGFELMFTFSENHQSPARLGSADVWGEERTSRKKR